MFLSATLGVMSVQGRSNRLLASLSWAWWVGLAGLIVTIVCWIALIIFYIYIISSSSPSNTKQKVPRSFDKFFEEKLVNYVKNILEISP